MILRSSTGTGREYDRSSRFGVSEDPREKGKGLDFRLRERILPSDLPDPTFLFVVAEQGQST